MTKLHTGLTAKEKYFNLRYHTAGNVGDLERRGNNWYPAPIANTECLQYARHWDLYGFSHINLNFPMIWDAIIFSYVIDELSES